MGVDHYNCDSCGCIYADCDSGGSCDSCHKSWCDDCFVTVFWYGTTLRCDLCFRTAPPHITKKNMLDYALSLLGKKREELVDEMKSLPKFSRPENTYTCQIKGDEHMCDPRCESLGGDYDDPDKDEVVRGMCCRAKFKEEDEKEFWCKECANTVKRIKR